MGTITHGSSSAEKEACYLNVTLREGFLYGLGVAHLDRAASGLTPSSATSRTPNIKAETGDPESSGRYPAARGVKPSRLTCRPVDLFRTRQLTSQALRGNHHVPFFGSVAPFTGRAASCRSRANRH